ncbi:MAG TPA: aspartate aminotransferase family protein [Algoriphagus sp.]|jgi:acetylornithine/succinyldiaminopimelate/putrescine aminotransferase|uniref:aspartate aminotransferase family protein n=1 Tax=unclassified Algoriphagus TaxID=2641541 RepID=UPI000C43B91A|nr:MULTISPECIES: aspartate aminotransferase family protein [unclassified Algoriphagus]MAL13484.1 aspartate aminotransferase family protein [Algoriphagus sp.]HAS58911.1 aspartate aminotransferase family protein [Algoriphagus sp.]HCB46952.1 aspartate aminotransferase family protein [Algoriphagus sp.]HCD87208.1 aspartate aminotransferase family protein [Algoriphagus sp.]|tara:strand:- start:1737 stop:2921 length:1185 start_codon:yes stop_codon:yes gene_type:complete
MNNRQLFLSHLAQTTDFPLMIEVEKAEGVYLYGPNQEKYIDLISGIGVSNVGHRHPKVLEAIQNQLDKYLHLMVYGEYVQTPQTLLAKALCDTLPNQLDNVYFVNSGSEAIEGALKLAKRYTGKKKLFSCINAYHGSSHGSLSIGGNEIFKRAYRPLLPGVTNIVYGGYADLVKIDSDTAAVVVETIQGEAGIRVACTNYFQALRKKCDEVGALLILDEIQAGFGRTGKFWAFEHFDIVPDIVVCAKGMGGGMPIGAFIANKEVMGVFKNNPLLGHITTFGGHPVSAAASLATIQILQKENLIAQVEEKAALFKKLLIHPKIKGIRNKGLMMAVEFESFEVLKPIIDRAIELGVITDWFLFCDDSMRIAPPLVITEEEIKGACSIILQAIEDVA